jgi:Lamin Tail Domain
MRLFYLIGLLLFSASVCSAQVIDDFSDGDYSLNPVWTPDAVANWTINAGQLRSNSATTNSTFSISTPSTQALNAQWEFYVNLQFPTSGLNFVDVYLMSSTASMTLANGYFVRIGGTPDEISLYKSTNGVATVLVDGIDGTTNSSNNKLKIRVTRDVTDLWKLERDVSGTGNTYVTEGTKSDNSFSTSSFFGIKITQSTASFTNKHFFDDFYIGPLIGDTKPPTIISVSVLSGTQLDLLFDEPLEQSSASQLTNFSVDQGIGNPSTAVLQPDQKTIRLTFSQPFPNGVARMLSIANINDVAGNSMVSTTRPFLYFLPTPTSKKDIIITEIFADPTPQLGLPDAEYIEIYNRSKNPIDMAGWKLSDGSTTATFATQIILPNEYWIVTSSSSFSKFIPLGKTIGLPNFPTLNNDGDILSLRTSTAIDSVNYKSSWYLDEDKQGGGWSLELIDPENTCGEAANWVASEDALGGTPGKQNSVFANKPDLTGPKLVSVIALPNQLVLGFDEKLETPLGSISILVEPNRSVAKYYFNNQALTEIKVELGQPLASKQLYSIQVKNLRDCASNFIQPQFYELEFALSEKADSLDIIINEVLFNPRTGGVDFLEIYNRSTKFINLKNHKVANYEANTVRNEKSIDRDLMLKPGAYLVFTSNALALKSQYGLSIERNFFEMDMPSFNDNDGTVALVSDEQKVGDFFIYSEDMHTPLLKDKEGVSLERISVLENTNDRYNWKSAASSVGFATPGYLNSNARPDNLPVDKSVSVEPEVFSPDRIGQNFSKINYRFEQSGLVANVKILDQQGRLVKTIANNETIGLAGFFRWDGDREDGNRARLGYYIVWMETFDTTGQIQTFRQRIAVAEGN